MLPVTHRRCYIHGTTVIRNLESLHSFSLLYYNLWLPQADSKTERNIAHPLITQTDFMLLDFQFIRLLLSHKQIKCVLNQDFKSLFKN
jgi:hypothetical protein